MSTYTCFYCFLVRNSLIVVTCTHFSADVAVNFVYRSHFQHICLLPQQIWLPQRYLQAALAQLHNLRERPFMTSHIFWPFSTYYQYLVLLYNVQFLGLSWTPLPTIISDVINGRSGNHRFISILSVLVLCIDGYIGISICNYHGLLNTFFS